MLVSSRARRPRVPSAPRAMRKRGPVVSRLVVSLRLQVLLVCALVLLLGLWIAFSQKGYTGTSRCRHALERTSLRNTSSDFVHACSRPRASEPSALASFSELAELAH